MVEYYTTMQFESQKMTQVFTPTVHKQLALMVLVELIFQTSEYVLAVVFRGNPKSTLTTLLINKTYLLDMIFTLSEYFIEVFFVPELKQVRWTVYVGMSMVVTGEIIRKMAIITAGYGFTHQIRTDRDEEHQLVTHGIYRYMRHPGYLGYLIWSVGVQIMLCNPLWAIGLAVDLWRFFSDRILYEEKYLREFFGERYDEYARRVPSGVPFVR